MTSVGGARARSCSESCRALAWQGLLSAHSTSLPLLDVAATLALPNLGTSGICHSRHCLTPYYLQTEREGARGGGGVANTFNIKERVYSRAIAFSDRRCSVPLESALPNIIAMYSQLVYTYIAPVLDLSLTPPTLLRVAPYVLSAQRACMHILGKAPGLLLWSCVMLAPFWPNLKFLSLVSLLNLSVPIPPWAGGGGGGTQSSALCGQDCHSSALLEHAPVRHEASEASPVWSVGAGTPPPAPAQIDVGRGQGKVRLREGGGRRVHRLHASERGRCWTGPLSPSATGRGLIGGVSPAGGRGRRRAVAQTSGADNKITTQHNNECDAGGRTPASQT